MSRSWVAVHSVAGMTIVEDTTAVASGGLTPEQRAANATGAPNTDTLYRNAVPAWPTIIEEGRPRRLWPAFFVLLLP